MDQSTLAALLDAHAPWGPLKDVPGISAWQAPDEFALWHALESHLQAPVPPPFFAVAWPGARALARVILQGDVPVKGRTVVDVGCGSGVAAAAAARAGGVSAAVDVDGLALLATRELARRNGVQVETILVDPLARPAALDTQQVILGGDLFYNEQGARLGALAVAHWRSQGALVVLADAGRPFFNAVGLAQVWEGEFNVPRGVEGVEQRVCRVFAG